MLKKLEMDNLRFDIFFHLPFWLLILLAVLAPFDQYQRDIFLGMSLQRIIFIFLAIFFLAGLVVGDRKIYFTPLIIPLVLYLVAHLIGAIQGEQPVATKAVIRTSGYIALFVISANLPRTQKQVLVVVLSFILSLFFVEILAVFKLITEKSLFGFNLIEVQENLKAGVQQITRLKGTCENINEFATLMVLALPISICILHKDFWRRSILLLAYFFGWICLLATQSKSALLGVLVGLIVALAYLFQKGKEGKIIVLFAVTLAILSVLAFNFGALPGLKKTNVTARVLNMKEYTSERDAARPNIYREFAKFILKHPFGTGIGRTAETVKEYSGKFKKLRSGHNVFLSAGAQNGWLGIISVFLVFVMLFYHLGIGIKRSNTEFEAVLILGFFSSFVAFFIHTQFHNLLKWNIVWLLFGIAFASLRISKERFVKDI